MSHDLRVVRAVAQAASIKGTDLTTAEHHAAEDACVALLDELSVAEIESEAVELEPVQIGWPAAFVHAVFIVTTGSLLAYCVTVLA